MPLAKFTVFVLLITSIFSCSDKKTTIDMVVFGNAIYQGSDHAPIEGVIGIDKGRIIFVGDKLPKHFIAKEVIDAKNMIVAPGFIDPHTHACSDFSDDTVPNVNANYLTQGVSTVFCNVDGGGRIEVNSTLSHYEAQGIGTNVALYIGHGSVRKAVMGRSNRAPTDGELAAMKNIVDEAMQSGALGLSTGLYYVPGNYAATSEVVELAKVVASYGGVYDSHIRDESTYSVGLVEAIKEVINIGKQAKLPVHVAHIKALGVDVWGKSDQVIELIKNARSNGVDITADQYPWRASGTSVAGSLMPRSILAGDKSAYISRVKSDKEWPKLKAAMLENLRRRGGAESLTITDLTLPELRGKTLAEIAKNWKMSPVDAARKIVISGNARVASFNMSEKDVKAFMMQPWVMTSSDGSPGHPRKYASFPKKYYEFVLQNPWLNTKEFIYKSSTLTAKTFGLSDRGELKANYVADIVIFDPKSFMPIANYVYPEKLSKGVEWMIINGQLAISNGQVTGVLAGKSIRQGKLVEVVK